MKVLDLIDGLLALGFLLMIAGAAFVYWPGAIMLAGVLLAAFALLSIGRPRR